MDKMPQNALKSMDLIELLNKEFKGNNNATELSNYKVALYLWRLGYRPSYQEDCTIEDLEMWLEENDGAYTSEIWFEELVTTDNSKIDKRYSCIFELIAEKLGFRFEIIPSIYIGFDSGLDTDTGITTSITCKDEQQAEYVEWWCRNFDIQYERQGYEFGLYDFSEENDMAFLFLYENGKIIEECAIDWSCGYDNVSNDMAQALADKDVDMIFTKYSDSDSTARFINDLMDMISDTKEVVF